MYTFFAFRRASVKRRWLKARAVRRDGQMPPEHGTARPCLEEDGWRRHRNVYKRK